jgi:hypothetical protein
LQHFLRGSIVLGDLGAQPPGCTTVLYDRFVHQLHQATAEQQMHQSMGGISAMGSLFRHKSIQVFRTCCMSVPMVSVAWFMPPLASCVRHVSWCLLNISLRAVASCIEIDTGAPGGMVRAAQSASIIRAYDGVTTRHARPHT